MILLGAIILISFQVSGYDINVSVFYYPWYDTNRHWGEGYLREYLKPAQPPMLGHYSNRDTDLIDQHIEWSESYGIDTWICSWWGPSCWEQRTIKESIASALEGSNVTFCLYYESAGLLNMTQGQINFDESRSSRFRNHIKFIAEQFFEHPSYHRINGRPVLYLYLTRTFRGNYAEAISGLRQDMRDMGYDIFLIGDEVYWGSPNSTRIKTLDAIFAYNMHGPHEYDGYPSQTHFLRNVETKYKSYSRIAERYDVHFIPKIMPGFNDRGVRLNADHYIIPSRVHPDSSHTSTFTHYIDLALPLVDPEIKTVCVTSFNEWHEDTQIEPTIRVQPTNQDISGQQTYTQGNHYTGYGEDYLQIIKDRFGAENVGIQHTIPTTPDLRVRHYPNPFNQSITIEYTLTNPATIQLDIYNTKGTLVFSSNLGRREKGAHYYHCNLDNRTSGLYFYRIRTRYGKSRTGKITFLK